MILVSENLNAADPLVAEALHNRNPEPIRALAEASRCGGASYLDVNLGPGSAGGPSALDFVLDALAGCWSGGLLIDTTSPAVMERAAARAPQWPGPVVLNGYSGDPGREAVLEIAARHGLEVVVLLMARGIPRTVDERLALAVELAGRCQEMGIILDRLWIDPMIAPLGWSEGQALDAGLIEILRRLPEVFGGSPRTIVGLSNLTTRASGGRRVPWLEEVFLALAAGAGLTHAMVNMKSDRLVRVARALDVLEGRRLFAPEEFAPGR